VPCRVCGPDRPPVAGSLAGPAGNLLQGMI